LLYFAANFFFEEIDNTMKIKGFILHSRKEFVLDNFGNDGWNKVLATLPDEDKKIYEGFILTSNWYDFEISERLDTAIVEILGKGSTDVFEDIGKKSAQRHLTGIHASFIVPGNPQAFLEKADVIYKYYYDVGYREYEATGTNSGILTTYESEVYSAPDCLTVIGWHKEALRMCGAKEVQIEEEVCRAKGGDYCQYMVQWQI
jgi:predicted hydrocarbon binding protein